MLPLTVELQPDGKSLTPVKLPSPPNEAVNWNELAVSWEVPALIVISVGSSVIVTLVPATILFNCISWSTFELKIPKPEPKLLAVFISALLVN